MLYGVLKNSRFEIFANTDWDSQRLSYFFKDKIFGTRVDFFWNTPLFLRYDGVNATNAEKCVAKRR